MMFMWISVWFDFQHPVIWNEIKSIPIKCVCVCVGTGSSNRSSFDFKHLVSSFKWFHNVYLFEAIIIMLTINQPTTYTHPFSLFFLFINFFLLQTVPESSSTTNVRFIRNNNNNESASQSKKNQNFDDLFFSIPQWLHIDLLIVLRLH